MDKNLGKKVPGSVFVSCNYIYTKINESVSNRATIFDVCSVERGRKSEEKRKRRGGGMFSFVRWNGKKEMRRETFVSIKL